ncbi:hypothetical protein NDU88_004232 [Pleurodeles waltl]|uniref:Uncharacterized protein n=1 Tax=Pleurodeles waltl TaxID=8319 RepID=A0AAV7VJC4_PLEWA|nr:hypothetical protein NDU88_004232 [Pleurodeles waltl]
MCRCTARMSHLRCDTAGAAPVQVSGGAVGCCGSPGIAVSPGEPVERDGVAWWRSTSVPAREAHLPGAGRGQEPRGPYIGGAPEGVSSSWGPAAGVALIVKRRVPRRCGAAAAALGLPKTNLDNGLAGQGESRRQEEYVVSPIGDRWRLPQRGRKALKE